MTPRLRAIFIALPFALVTVVLGGITASSCSSDDDSCNGRILSTCSDCTCTAGQTTTCTAWPRGDENSNQRCCECN